MDDSLKAKISGSDNFAAGPSHLSVTRLWQATKRALGRIISSEAGLRCAGVAFYGFLSLFPAIASAVILFGLFLDQSLISRILDTAAPLLPSGPQTILREQLTRLQEANNTSLGIGLLLTLGFALWSGTRGTNAMVYAVTRAYREKDERSFLHSAIISISLTLMAYFIAAIAMTAIAVIPITLNLVGFSSQLESYIGFLRWPLIAALIIGATILFYRIAPHRNPAKLAWILPGAILSSTLWLIASWGFSFYVENFGSYDATFGSLSAVVVLLLWMYYSSMIFVLGAMINAELELETLRDTTIGSPRPIGERNAFVADHISDDIENL